MNDFIKIYTDGSAKGNPGPGGYGIVLKYKGKVKEIAQGYRHTTNNRMELLAVIVALESLKTSNIPIQVFSDSKYVIDSIVKKWVFSWEKKNFKGKKTFKVFYLKTTSTISLFSPPLNLLNFAFKLSTMYFLMLGPYDVFPNLFHILIPYTSQP